MSEIIDRIKAIAERKELDIEDVFAEFDALSEEGFDEFINECYPEVEIFGVKYSISFLLSQADEIHYSCAYSDWIDQEGIEFDGEYYLESDLEQWIEENEGDDA